MNGEAIKSFFESFVGKEIAIEESLRFLLHDPHSILYIEKGSVDIFALSLEGEILFSNKEQMDEMGLNTTPFLAELLEGPLTYISSLKEGDLLFPFPFCSNLDSMRIVAVAITPLSLKKASFRLFQDAVARNPLLIKEVDNQVNDWITVFDQLAKSPSNHIDRRQPPTLDPHETLSVPKDFILSRPKGGTIKEKNVRLWVETLQGPLGVEIPSTKREKYYIVQPGAPPFPLMQNLYLECLEDCTFSTSTFEDLVKGARLIWSILCFHQAALQWLTAALQLKKQLEIKDWQISIKNDRELFQNALKKSSHILEPLSSLSEGVNRDPLLAACEWIGERENLQFLQPPNHGQEPDWDERIDNVCSYSGIAYRKVYLQDRWWEVTEGYILGFNKDNRPCPIQCHIDGKSTLIDLDKGTEKPLTTETVQELFPFGYIFYRQFPEKNSIQLRDLLHFIFSRKNREVKIVVVCGFLAVLVSLFMPYATQVIFDQVIPTLDATLLWQIALGMLVSVVSTALFKLVKEYTINRMLSLLDINLMGAVWNRLLSLKVNFFQGYEVGDLYLRVQGVSDIAKKIAGSPLRVLLNVLFSFLYLISMFYYSVSLTWISLLVIAVLGMITAVFISKNFAIQKKIMDIKGFTSSKVIEIIKAITKVRTSGIGQRMFAYWLQNFNQAKALEKKQLSNQNIVTCLLSFAPNFAYFLILGMVIYTLSDQPPGVPAYISVGSLMAFLAAYSPFSESIFEGLTTLIEMQTLKPLWERSQPFLEEPPELDNHKAKWTNLEGAIRFEHVSFRYGPDHPLILKDVSFDIQPGEFVGIVGLSGAGKSTIIRLIVGLETPESGEIFIDNHSLKNLDLPNFRRQISTVLQQGFIASGSLREYLTGGKSFSDQRLLWALNKAGFTEDLNNLPMGLETLLINGAGTFSGGQRQRLMLAKALVANPKIILLDEATSALDNKTQELVKSNLDALQITRVVVAHRLSTVRMADKIYVLDEGVIADQGTFDELSNKMGLFADLLEKQKG